MRMNYVPKHSRDHADSECVSHVLIVCKEPSLLVTNKQIHSLTHRHSTLYISTRVNAKYWCVLYLKYKIQFCISNVFWIQYFVLNTNTDNILFLLFWKYFTQHRSWHYHYNVSALMRQQQHNACSINTDSATTGYWRTNDRTGLKAHHVVFQPWYLSFIIPVLHFSLLHTECHAQQSALRSKDNYHSSKQ